MSSTAIAGLILEISANLIEYSVFIMFGLGVFGHIMIIAVFKSLSVFQGKCCVMYLTVESIVNIFLLVLLCVLQAYITMYGMDMASASVYYCKSTTTLGQASRLILDYVVCFQALDQFLSTHPLANVRSCNTLKFAKKLVIISSLVWILQTIPYCFYYEIVPLYGCIINNELLKNYYTFFHYLVLHGFLPISISAIFSLLAFRNVRRIVRRQIPIVRRRLDRQLTAMIYVRVIFFIVSSTQYTLLRASSLNINVYQLTPLGRALVQLATAISKSITFANYSLNFYIFLCTSARFRQQVKYFLTRKCWILLKRSATLRFNKLHPMNVASVDNNLAI